MAQHPEQNDVETVPADNAFTHEGKQEQINTNEQDKPAVGKIKNKNKKKVNGKPPTTDPLSNNDIPKLENHPPDHGDGGTGNGGTGDGSTGDGGTGKKKKKKKKKKKENGKPSTNDPLPNNDIPKLENHSTLPPDHRDGCTEDGCTGDGGTGDGGTEDGSDGKISTCNIAGKHEQTDISKSVTSVGQCNEHSEPLNVGSNIGNGLTQPVVEANSTSLDGPVAPNACPSQPVEQNKRSNSTACASNGKGSTVAESFAPVCSRKAKRKRTAQNANSKINSHTDSTGLVQANVQDKNVNSTTTELHQRTSDEHKLCQNDTENENGLYKKPHINKNKLKNKKERKEKSLNSFQKKCEEKIQGLVNSGSTCYMNAALQLLCSADTFREFKLEHSLQDKENNRFIHQFMCLMHQMREKRTSPLDASHVKYEVGKTVHRFSETSEQDSQEFLTVVLERIHNSLKVKHDLTAASSPDLATSSDKEKIRVHAEESWHLHLEQGYSVVVELFQGQLVSTMECDACKHVVMKFDPFMFLPVPVPSRKSASLQECLQLYTKEEIIDGWPCSACHEVVQLKRRVQLWKTPPFLMLYLKRYKLDKTGERHKVCTPVKFPLSSLDLSSSSHTPKEETLYNLCAVINHYEYEHNSRGHYTTVSRCGEEWFCFDDTKVCPCPESDIVTPAAYVLLYKRNDITQSESKVTDAEGSRLDNTGPLAPFGEADKGSCVSNTIHLLSELKDKITDLSVSSVDKNEMAEKLLQEVDRIVKEIEENTGTRNQD